MNRVHRKKQKVLRRTATNKINMVHPTIVSLHALVSIIIGTTMKYLYPDNFIVYIVSPILVVMGVCIIIYQLLTISMPPSIYMNIRNK